MIMTHFQYHTLLHVKFNLTLINYQNKCLMAYIQIWTLKVGTLTIMNNHSLLTANIFTKITQIVCL